MKMTEVLDRLMAAVSLRIAWDMRRAWRPTWLSPISPSISALGTRAATESMTTTSTAPLRTSTSTISSACSPVSGWETSSSSVRTPMPAGVLGVEGVLRVDEGGHASAALGLGDDVEGQRGLARALRAEDLDHPAAGDAADAEGDVEGEGTGRDDLDALGLGVAEAHDRALAVSSARSGSGPWRGLARAPSSPTPPPCRRGIAARSPPLYDQWYHSAVCLSRHDLLGRRAAAVTNGCTPHCSGSGLRAQGGGAIRRAGRGGRVAGGRCPSR